MGNRILLGLVSLSLVISSNVRADQLSCSASDVENGLKFLQKREKVARKGLEIWSDTRELEKNVKGAKNVVLASSVALGVSLAASGTAFGLANAVYSATGTVAAMDMVKFTMGLGAVSFAGNVFGQPKALGFLGREVSDPERVANDLRGMKKAFSAFDEAHEVARKNRQKAGEPSRWSDLLTLGGKTLHITESQLLEAQVHQELFRQEMKVIRNLNEALKEAKAKGYCDSKTSAIADTQKKVIQESVITAPPERNVTSAWQAL